MIAETVSHIPAGFIFNVTFDGLPAGWFSQIITSNMSKPISTQK
jgi:hypothetical protein